MDILIFYCIQVHRVSFYHLSYYVVTTWIKLLTSVLLSFISLGLGNQVQTMLLIFVLQNHCQWLSNDQKIMNSVFKYIKKVLKNNDRHSRKEKIYLLEIWKVYYRGDFIGI